MLWEEVGTRNLRLVEGVSEREREQLNQLLSEMCRLRDAETMASQIRRDVLKRGILENYKLDRTETLARLSTWCHAVAKHKSVRPCAEEIARLIFAGHIPPRLVKKDSKSVHNAPQLLDEFIAKVIRDQRGYIHQPAAANNGRPRHIGGGDDHAGEPEVTPPIMPPATLSVERDLRKHIAYNPTVIAEGLKTIAEEYATEVGRVDVLCEDDKGHLVVVELKKGRSGDTVVGQIQRYMGWLKLHEKRPVRGVIILGEPDEHVRYAIAVTPNIQVKYYRVQFEITDEPSA